MGAVASLGYVAFLVGPPMLGFLGEHWGLRLGMLEGNTDEGYIALGTGIGNIRSVKSVAEVVDALTVE